MILVRKYFWSNFFDMIATWCLKWVCRSPFRWGSPELEITAVTCRASISLKISACSSCLLLLIGFHLQFSPQVSFSYTLLYVWPLKHLLLTLYFLLLFLFYYINFFPMFLHQKASSNRSGPLYSLILSAPCVWASHCNSDLFSLFIWDVELAPCTCDLFFWHLFFLQILTLSFCLLSRLHFLLQEDFPPHLN